MLNRIVDGRLTAYQVLEVLNEISGRCAYLASDILIEGHLDLPEDTPPSAS